MLKIYKNIILLLVLITLTFSSGCWWEEEEAANDLELAGNALRKHEYGDAEMYFQRYLRKNPEGDERWIVWNKLLEMILDTRQDRRMAREYLEIMLVEFADKDDHRREIQIRLANLCNDMRQYDRAVQLWEALAEDQGLKPEVKSEVCRHLAKAFLRRLEFTVATDILQQCLTLDISDASKAKCLYDLAETQMLTEELEASEATLRDLLSRENMPDDLRVLAVFMLGDVLEQDNKYDEAKELFESIRATYPNKKVIELRIAYLNNKKK